MRRPSRSPPRRLGARIALGVALGVGVLIGAAAALTPTLARSWTIRALHARGIEATIEHVGFAWGPSGAASGELRLRGVHATLEGVGRVVLDANEVDVAVATDGAHDVVVTGGKVAASGSIDALRTDVDGWRARRGVVAANDHHGGRTITLDRLAVAWTDEGGVVRDAAIDRAVVSPATVDLRGVAATVDLKSIRAHVTGASFVFDRESRRLSRAHAGTLVVSRDKADIADASDAPPPDVAPSASASAAHIAGAPSPSPSGASSVVAVSVPVSVVAPSVMDRATNALARALPAAASPPGAHHLWTLLNAARAVLDRAAEHVTDDADLAVDSLSFDTGHERLGPWSARVSVTTSSVAFEVQPLAGEGRKPLDIRALVPRVRGPWTAEMHVGPAKLGELGIPDGPLGLHNTAATEIEARGSVEVDPEQERLVVDGSAHIKGATIDEPKLADGPLEGVDVSARGLLTTGADFHSWTLKGGAVSLGRVVLELEGTYDRDLDAQGALLGSRVVGTWSLPTLPCADALASMPKGLLPKLEGLAMDGTLEAHGALSLDTRARDKARADLALDQQCRMTRVPPVMDVDQFTRPFELRVYDPHGNPTTKTFGPGTAGWVSYEKISPYVVDALLTCEDGAFFSHHGFSALAIRNALLANIKAGSFRLGASTVTMQLAKNIFLDRRKLLSRKLQEAVLTAWIEQSLSKSEILELYLNVIEFGPDLYGIGPAAQHYFGRPASDLDPLEALFLVSILPAPVRSHGMWERGGIGDGYAATLRHLLREEHARGLLEDDEYEASKDEALAFHKPGDPEPPLRAVGGKLRLSPEKDGDPAFDPAWAPASDER